MGVLYATGALQPVLVRIPFKHGVPAFRSSRDLEIAYWVNQPNGRVLFGSNYAHVVHYTSDRRPASFTVFREIFMNLPPTNGLLGRFRNVNDADLGNVLTIKHPLRDVRRIEHMTRTDLACAAKLYQLLMTDFLQGRCMRSSVGFKFAERRARTEGDKRLFVIRHLTG
jgi:hypothetical protein